MNTRWNKESRWWPYHLWLFNRLREPGGYRVLGSTLYCRPCSIRHPSWSSVHANLPKTFMNLEPHFMQFTTQIRDREFKSWTSGRQTTVLHQYKVTMVVHVSLQYMYSQTPSKEVQSHPTLTIYFVVLNQWNGQTLFLPALTRKYP
jgi:hypothetical protein